MDSHTHTASWEIHVFAARTAIVAALAAPPLDAESEDLSSFLTRGADDDDGANAFAAKVDADANDTVEDAGVGARAG